MVSDCLRLLGQLGLTGEIAPIRHPAKRRRLKTVLQEIMYRAAKFVAHARQLVLDFGRGFAKHVQVFVALQERLLKTPERVMAYFKHAAVQYAALTSI